MSAMPERRRCSSAFLAMKRASLEYGSRLIGSTTSQMRNSVLCDRTGSIVAESGSGIKSMSLSSIDWKPRMLEPSKPRPSLKLSTSSSPSGRLKCCHVPGRSMNRTSTTSTPSAFARSRTSRGLVLLPDLLPDFVSTAINTLHEYAYLTGHELIVGSRRAYHQVRLLQSEGGHFRAINTKMGSSQGILACVNCTRGRIPICQIRTFLRPAGRTYAGHIKRCG